MGLVHSRWDEVESMMRREAYATLDNDPQVLLERDAWFDVDADLFYARLIGFEDEIVEDGLRLPRVEQEILVPVPTSIGSWLRDTTTGPPLLRPTRTARYVLQSGLATVSISGKYQPPCPLRQDFTAKIAYLRYRRRV